VASVQTVANDVNYLNHSATSLYTQNYTGASIHYEPTDDATETMTNW